MAKTRKPIPAPEPQTKLDRVIAALSRTEGTTIPDLVDLTGWQEKSVRGFLSGVLKKKRALNVVSEKLDGVRTYRIRDFGRASAAECRDRGPDTC